MDRSKQHRAQGAHPHHKHNGQQAGAGGAAAGTNVQLIDAQNKQFNIWLKHTLQHLYIDEQSHIFEILGSGQEVDAAHWQQLNIASYIGAGNGETLEKCQKKYQVNKIEMISKLHRNFIQIATNKQQQTKTMMKMNLFFFLILFCRRLFNLCPRFHLFHIQLNGLRLI
jgi:hypothetical protein